MVDPGTEPFKPKKKQPNVIMYVGLQVRGLVSVGFPPRSVARPLSLFVSCVYTRVRAGVVLRVRTCVLV